MQVEEPKDWTNGERKHFLALVGRGVIDVVRTLPDGRAVFELSEAARRALEEAQ
jgi:hypothetical protein